jgi:hypothetical protein
MPRYYFHICNGQSFAEDEEGCEFPNDDAARQSAIVSARDIMTGDLRNGELDLTSFIEVEDEQKRLLFTLTFAEAVTITTSREPSKAQLEAHRRRQ